MTEEADKPTNPQGEGPTKSEGDGLTKSERVFVRIALLQTLLAVIGIVTGSIALYAGLTEADAARKQQEAAVWPMLQMAINDYDVEAKEPIFRIMARNSGIGPARIAGFRVMVGGKVQSDWNEAFTTLAGSHEGVLRSYFSGRVISAGGGGRRSAGTGRDRARGVAKSVRRTDASRVGGLLLLRIQQMLGIEQQRAVLAEGCGARGSMPGLREWSVPRLARLRRKRSGSMSRPRPSMQRSVGAAA